MDIFTELPPGSLTGLYLCNRPAPHVGGSGADDTPSQTAIHRGTTCPLPSGGGERSFDGSQRHLMPMRSRLPETSTLSSKFNAFKHPIN